MLPFVGSGIAAGLAYLTRNDGVLLIPMLIVTLIVLRAAGANPRPPFTGARAMLMPLVALIVVTPWLIRNLNAIGMLGSPETSSMFFFTDHNDHYAFAPHFTLQTMLAAQTPGADLGKRLFELAAAFKVMIQSFDVFLPVMVVAGAAADPAGAEHDRRRLLALAPVLILVLGLLVAYPILIPYKSQAGSFKKAYLSI